MRVAFDVTPARLSGGGVGTYTRELLAALHAAESVDVVEIAHAGTARGLGPGRIVGGLAREAWYYPLGAGRRARAARADLLHVPAAMPAREARGLPVVLTVHDALPWTNPEWFTRANALQQRLLVTGAARRARRVITVSEEARRQLIAHVGIDGDRIDVVHNGISGRFGPQHRDRDWLRARFGVDGPTVLVVGTPEPRKNLSGAIAAFAGVRRSIPGARLIIAGGDGWGLPHLDAVLRPLGDAAVATGRLSEDDLVRLYASGDCLLFPSFAEGFGLPPLEAMASGTPVVCSDRSSLPEVVGDAARLCDPDDHEALAAAVVEVLEDAPCAARLREHGLVRSAEFTWQRAAEGTLAAYRRAIPA